jgi:hypothetical protein
MNPLKDIVTMGIPIKSISINVLIASIFTFLPLLANAQEKVANQDIQQARALVNAFGTDLKQVLTTAIKSEGPIKALMVCNIEAEPIATKHASLSGWRIARTSMRVRNEKNTPDEWELAVLQQFEKRKIAGENLKTMEYAETVKEGDQLVYRYMKPIPTVGACLTCHGINLGDKITDKVKSLYPNDQAIGFNMGDIRGAFTLQKIMN